MKVMTIEEIKADIQKMMDSERTSKITMEDGFFYEGSGYFSQVFNVKYNNFDEDGISQLGTRVGYPAQFVRKLVDNGHTALAENIMTTTLSDYLSNHEFLYKRDFFGKTFGFLTERYAFFDDDEIFSIIEENEYLMNCDEIWGNISPRHTHLRFISGNKLYIDGDDSPLSMCVFIDNSMTGSCAFKIRFGIYRWACTNGMISNLKEFEIARERHLGFKEFEDITLKALEEIPLYEQMLLDKVVRMRDTKAHIYAMTEEDAKTYIKEYLTTSKKVAEDIYKAFLFYGGVSQWDFCNAITDVAHSQSLDNRLLFEQRAFA